MSEDGVKKSSNPWVSMTAGTIAGGIECVAVWPMEYIKTQLQLQSISKTGQKPLYTGVISGLKYTVQTTGFLSLYRGLGVTLVGSLLQRAAGRRAGQAHHVQAVHGWLGRRGHRGCSRSDAHGDHQDEAHPDQPAAASRGAEHIAGERSPRPVPGRVGHGAQAGLQPGPAVHVLQQVQGPADGQRPHQAVPAGLPRRRHVCGLLLHAGQQSLRRGEDADAEQRSRGQVQEHRGLLQTDLRRRGVAGLLQRGGASHGPGSARTGCDLHELRVGAEPGGAILRQEVTAIMVHYHRILLSFS
eukprot:CAMPEP_0170102922 /NCGR_PEP_ID=MMETSP0020_2-20130122/3175_1 /TAXON_ID=98059 /ORGANISM="Dinobryon sp., Strain UTEXLB2267" /LENGTH=298 /DNA_ID=CAMNT_0010326367 /DNA_START=107 /DNA_END=1003 /DNA_ORIENTATION=+